MKYLFILSCNLHGECVYYRQFSKAKMPAGQTTRLASFLHNSIKMTIFAAGSVTRQTKQKKEETFLQLANRLKNSLLI